MRYNVLVNISGFEKGMAKNVVAVLAGLSFLVLFFVRGMNICIFYLYGIRFAHGRIAVKVGRKELRTFDYL